MKAFENEIEQLRLNIKTLTQELEVSKAKEVLLRDETGKKDKEIMDLKDKLEKGNKKLVTQNPKDFSFMRQKLEKETSNKEFTKELSKENLLIEEAMLLKRKYDDIPKVKMGLMEMIDEDKENSKSSSTTHPERLEAKREKSEDNFERVEDLMNIDEFKFKKVFKKVKKSDNNSKDKGNNSTSTPFGLNNSREMITKPSQLVNFDDDDSLKNLLNNFIDTKADNKENSPKDIMNKLTTSNKNDKKSNFLQIESNKTDLTHNFFSDGEKDGKMTEEKDFKDYKKTVGGVAFSQKSPLKAFDLLTDSDNLKSIPITRNGRGGVKNESKAKMMQQKMMQGNKKRNSVETNNSVFKLSNKNRSTKSGDKTEENEKIKVSSKNINDEDLVRAPYRTKFEREGLQGFECDQCKKVSEVLI